MVDILLVACALVILCLLSNEMPSVENITKWFNISKSSYEKAYYFIVGCIVMVLYILTDNIIVTIFLGAFAMFILECLLEVAYEIKRHYSEPESKERFIKNKIISDNYVNNYEALIIGSFDKDEREAAKDILIKLIKDDSYIVKILKTESHWSREFDACIDAIKFTIRNDLKY